MGIPESEINTQFYSSRHLCLAFIHHLVVVVAVVVGENDVIESTSWTRTAVRDPLAGRRVFHPPFSPLSSSPTTTSLILVFPSSPPATFLSLSPFLHLFLLVDPFAKERRFHSLALQLASFYFILHFNYYYSYIQVVNILIIQQN